MDLTAADEAGYEASPENAFIDEIMMNLSRIGSRDQWFQWRNELFGRQTVDFRNKAAVRAWHEAIYRQHGPRLDDRRPCTLMRPTFYASRAGALKLPVNDSARCGDGVCANR